MVYNRMDYLAVGEVQDFIDFFEYEVEVNSTNRPKYIKELKLAEALKIYNSDMISLRKIYALTRLYRDGDALRSSFSKLRKFYDDKFIKGYLEKIDNLANYLDEAKEKGLIDKAKFLIENEDYFENYDYAKEYIEKYRKSNKIFTDDFLKDAGLSKSEFAYLRDIACELDDHLCILLKEKDGENLRERKYRTRRNFNLIYEGITTGKTQDGRDFDELEFMELLPFRNLKNLEELIKDYGCRNDNNFDRKTNRLLQAVVPDKAGVIFKYLIQHNLLPKTETYISEKEIRETKYILNNKEVTDEQKDTIIRYMNARELPFFQKTFILVRDEVLKGKIVFENEGKVLKMSK